MIYCKRQKAGGSGRARTDRGRIKSPVPRHLGIAPAELGAGPENRTQLCWFVGPVFATSEVARHWLRGQDSNLRVSRLTAGRIAALLPQNKPGGCGANRTLCLTVKGRLLILMSFAPRNPKKSRPMRPAQRVAPPHKPSRNWRDGRESNPSGPDRQSGAFAARPPPRKTGPALRIRTGISAFGALRPLPIGRRPDGTGMPTRTAI